MPAAAACDDGVGVLGGDHALFVRVGDGALVHREEAGARLHALGAQREGGGHAAPVGDAACGDHGDGHGVAYCGDERHRGQLADMAAGLGALGHHGVGSEALHARGQRAGGHHGHHLDAGVLPQLHVVRGRTRARRDDVNTQLRQKLGRLARVRIHEHDVRADGLVGNRAGDAHLLLDPVERRAAACDDAEAAGLAHRAGQARIRDARHRALHDGHLDAQQFRYPRLHAHALSSSNPRPRSGPVIQAGPVRGPINARYSESMCATS